MSILLVIPNRRLDKLVSAICAQLPEVKVEIWPDVKEPLDVEYIIAWLPPENSLKPFINCKVIASFGAGVDSLLSYKGLPNVPITRIVDDNLAQDMSRYVLTHILAHQHRLAMYQMQQGEQLWRPKRAIRNNKVAILGAGQLGGATAKRLVANDFDVSLWSRSRKHVENVACYREDELTQAVNDADYIVNLLPSTPSTRSFIDDAFFAKVKKGCVFINVARGDILCEQSLLRALASEHLGHAILDVFTTEPLPQHHEFWKNNKITITPHCSALSDIDTVTQQLCENFRRLKNGENLLNQVDLLAGY